MISLTAVIPDTLHNARLDQALAILFPDYSRARLQKWIREEKVKIEGRYRRAKDKVKTGEQIQIEAALEEATCWDGQAIPLDILYADAAILIVNKPAGLVVHPAAGNPDKTLVNALLHYDPALKNIPRAGIVHRLDKDTSGLLVVARTLAAHTHLVTQLQTRTVKREYLAIVQGVLISGGSVETAMGRHPHQRTKMAVVETGKEAITHYRIVTRFRGHTAVQVFLETGRTHQIRVHMAHTGHALVGDPLYGKRLKIPAGCTIALKEMLRGFTRQALHAKKLSLIHPVTKEEMSWEAPVPEDMQALLACMQEDIQAN